MRVGREVFNKSTSITYMGVVPDRSTTARLYENVGKKRVKVRERSGYKI